MKKWQEGQATGGVGYVNNTLGRFGETPLLSAINLGTDRLCYRRIARWLIDAGADTTSPVRLTGTAKVGSCSYSPLAYATEILVGKQILGTDRYSTENSGGYPPFAVTGSRYSCGILVVTR